MDFSIKDIKDIEFGQGLQLFFIIVTVLIPFPVIYFITDPESYYKVDLSKFLFISISINGLIITFNYFISVLTVGSILSTIKAKTGIDSFGLIGKEFASLIGGGVQIFAIAFTAINQLILKRGGVPKLQMIDAAFKTFLLTEAILWSPIIFFAIYGRVVVMKRPNQINRPTTDFVEKVAGNTALGTVIGGAIGGSAGAIIDEIMDGQATKITHDVPAANVTRQGEGVILKFDSNTTFEATEIKLSDAAKSSFGQLAEYFKANPKSEISIIGHTTAEQSVNQAKLIRDYLFELGVEESRLKYKGRGDSEPIVAYTSEDMGTGNSRIEIVLVANKLLKASVKANTEHQS